MCQRKVNVEIRMFFQNVVGMRTNGILKTKIENCWRPKFLGGRPQILQHILDMLLHIAQGIL